MNGIYMRRQTAYKHADYVNLRYSNVFNSVLSLRGQADISTLCKSISYRDEYYTVFFSLYKIQECYNQLANYFHIISKRLELISAFMGMAIALSSFHLNVSIPSRFSSS